MYTTFLKKKKKNLKITIPTINIIPTKLRIQNICSNSERFLRYSNHKSPYIISLLTFTITTLKIMQNMIFY